MGVPSARMTKNSRPISQNHASRPSAKTRRTRPNAAHRAVVEVAVELADASRQPGPQPVPGELHGAEPSRDEHQDAKREVEDQQGRAYLSADEQYGDADNQE